MADSDRIVFPDEVEDVKAKAAEANKPEAGDTNTVEDSPAEPQIQMRNMITVPSNCPPGYQMGADGMSSPPLRTRTVQPREAEDKILETFDSRKVQEAQKQGGVNSPVVLERGMSSRVVFEKVGPNSRVVLQREVNSPLVLEQQGVNSPNPNMIKVPGNCAPGEQQSKDGVCREVFD